MEIRRSRNYTWKTPILPAVREWLDNKLETVLKETTTAQSYKTALATFNDIPDEDIWTEYTLPVKENEGKYLACFSVIKRGFAVADAKLNFTELPTVIDYFAIKVVSYNTYTDLFKAIQREPRRCLYTVKQGSGKYGIIVDENLNKNLCYYDILSSLNDVCFDISVNFADAELSVSTPHVGEVTLSWPGFEPITLEALPLNEIKELVL